MFLQDKLQATVSGQDVIYHHPFDSHSILNDLIGRNFQISVSPLRQCLGCSKGVKKVVQGYCYLCSQRLARCDLCILKPHLCHYDQGTCREPQWGLEHCFSDHILYLSRTSGLKVGLSGAGRFLRRWVDQGAQQAALLASFSSRYEAGLVENWLSQSFNDKTNWRHLLTGVVCQDDNFEQTFREIQQQIAENTKISRDKVHLIDYQPHYFQYPVESYLERAKTVNLDKVSFFEDKLIGIKGQYMLFQEHGGLNMRKYQGYDMTMELV